MEWLAGTNISEISGWTAFGLLAATVVVAFIKGWIYTAGVVRLFKEAWLTERDTRIALESTKMDALNEQCETVIAQLKGFAEASKLGRTRGPRESGE